MTEVYASAVRWARREVRREPEWSKWHWSEDGDHTLCGHPVLLMGEAAMLPDTDDDPDRVDCVHCLRRMAALDAEANQ